MSAALNFSAQTLPCLSVRQPWAWHILHSGKDVENRDWATKVRGRVLLHASKGCTRDEYEDGQDPLRHFGRTTPELPPLADLPRGGIIGTIEIADCVADSSSPWFRGRYGFVLRNPVPMLFVPYRGALGFFTVQLATLQSTPHIAADRADSAHRATPEQANRLQIGLPL